MGEGDIQVILTELKNIKDDVAEIKVDIKVDIKDQKPFDVPLHTLTSPSACSAQCRLPSRTETRSPPTATRYAATGF
jgi:hypothetical protein